MMPNQSSYVVNDVSAQLGDPMLVMEQPLPEEEIAEDLLAYDYLRLQIRLLEDRVTVLEAGTVSARWGRFRQQVETWWTGVVTVVRGWWQSGGPRG